MPNAIQTQGHAPADADVNIAPENAWVLADRGSRLAAMILDSLIVTLLIALPLMQGVGWQGLHGLKQGDPTTLDAVAGSGMMALFGLVICAGLNLHFVRQTGQSIGKKMMGIKVVRSDGSKAGLGRIFWLRNVVSGIIGVIPLLGPLYCLLDTLMIFSAPRRCIHDLIADTFVIKA